VDIYALPETLIRFSHNLLGNNFSDHLYKSIRKNQESKIRRKVSGVSCHSIHPSNSNYKYHSWPQRNPNPYSSQKLQKGLFCIPTYLAFYQLQAFPPYLILISTFAEYMLKTACLYHKMQDFTIFDSQPNGLILLESVSVDAPSENIVQP